MKKLTLLVFILLLLTSSSNAQNGSINDGNYKFKIDAGKNWKQRSKVETNKKDVITYNYDRNDGKMTMSIIAFKFNTAKNIDDFIYTIEKDFNLNIPEKVNGYTDNNGGNYVGKIAEYKDNTSYEKIFYYTTTDESNGEYFCYMVRFICDNKTNQNDINTAVKNIIDTFKITI